MTGGRIALRASVVQVKAGLSVSIGPGNVLADGLIGLARIAWS